MPNNHKPLMTSASLPKPQGIFPTLGSLQEVHDLAESRLPILNKNDVTTLLGTYHNSLLKVIADAQKKTC